MQTPINTYTRIHTHTKTWCHHLNTNTHTGVDSGKRDRFLCSGQEDNKSRNHSPQGGERDVFISCPTRLPSLMSILAAPDFEKLSKGLQEYSVVCNKVQKTHGDLIFRGVI